MDAVGDKMKAQIRSDRFLAHRVLFAHSIDNQHNHPSEHPGIGDCCHANRRLRLTV